MRSRRRSELKWHTTTPKSEKSFQDFISNLSSVARRRNDCHIRRAQRPPKLYAADKTVQLNTTQVFGQKSVNNSQSLVTITQSSKKLVIATPMQHSLDRSKSFASALKTTMQGHQAPFIKKPNKTTNNKSNKKI